MNARRLLGVAVTALCFPVLLLTASNAGATTTAAAAAAPRAVGPLSVLTRLPRPGQPEGLAVDPTDGSVWSGSNRAGSPAVLWHVARDGRLLDTVEVTGHDSASPYAINGIALDGAGRVYALDYSGARAVRLDPRTGSQTVYATFPDLPACGLITTAAECEPGLSDRPAWPNWPTFDADGNLYVSDLHQATVWKVPPGGGRARVWCQDARFAGPYALNGMQFDDLGRLIVVNTLPTTVDGPLWGAVYRIAVGPDGCAGAPERIAATGIAADGLAIDTDGDLYVPVTNQLPVPGAPTLGVDAVEVYSPDGVLLTRLPTPEVQATAPVPFDAPASVAFDGGRMLVTNHARNSQDPDHFAILELPVDRTGLALHHPTPP